MSDYRRWFVTGGVYFFTVVTEQRRPIFGDERAVGLLGRVFRRVAAHRPFETITIVLLPDHLHCVWALPRGDVGYPGRWRWVKKAFSQEWSAIDPSDDWISDSRAARGELGFWQRRYWEHSIRDEQDLKQHVDYIHYNPVKHGYVRRAADWRWTSFHRFVRAGEYDVEWGSVEPEGPAFVVPV